MTTPAAAPSAAPASPSSSSPSSGGAAGQPSSTTSTGAPVPAPGSTGTPPGGSGTPTPGTSPQSPAPSRFKRKETINGKEVELEASEEELWASYRKNKAADQKFEEAARLRKEADQVRRQQAELSEALRRDPRKVMELLRDQGIEDPLDFVANALQAELVEAERLADPNVRRAHEAEQKLKQLEQQQQEQLKAQTQQQFEAEVNQELDRIGQLFSDAVALIPDLPKDADTLALMAELEEVNRRQGLGLTPQQLAQDVRDRVIGRGTGMLKKLAPERLLQVDPELTKMFHRALVADWKAKEAARQGQPPPQSQPPPAPASSQQAPSGPRVLTDREEAELLWGGKGKRVLPGI